MDKRSIKLKNLMLIAKIILFVALMNLMTSVIAAAANITYTYDSLKRVTSVDYGNGSTENYTYDAAGNRLTLDIKGPVNYYCDYDNDGQISESVSGTCSGISCQPTECQTTPGDDCDDRPNGEDGILGTLDDGANINLGATEVCNGFDDNCDSYVDETGNALCDNGLYCDGQETCGGIIGCQPGTVPVLDDGIGCTDDSCDDVNDVIVNTPDDGNCDNGLFCDGTETCDPVNDCQASNPPSVDDGVGCTNDSCDEINDIIVNTPVDGNCNNGLFCDGSELCDPVNDCQTGTAVNCDDGVVCTDDSCNEGTDSCDNVPNDAYCVDDGEFCTGVEFCDPINDCVSEGDPCYPNNCIEETDTCEQGDAPEITIPVSGSKLSSRTETFAWTGNGTAVEEWLIWMGPDVGQADIMHSGALGSMTLAEISGLPADGSQVYVRLWYLSERAWQFTDFQYTACTSCGIVEPAIVSPVPDATLTGSTVTFSWRGNGTAVTQYWLYVGDTGPDSNNIYSGDQGINTSKTVDGIPEDGRAINVTLLYTTAASPIWPADWQWVDHQYTSGIGTPTIVSPVMGRTLGSTEETFTWKANGTNVSAWGLEVGSTVGGSEIYTCGPSTELTCTVTGLPDDGSTVYVRLSYETAGVWDYVDYSYTACSACGSTEPEIKSPAPNTTLPCGDVIFTWSPNGTAVSEWWLWIGTTQGEQEIVNSGSMGTRTSTDPVSDLPQDGSQIWVRLHYNVNGLWLFRDFQYTAAGPGTCTPEISTPVSDSTLSGSSVDFIWTANGIAVSAWYLWAGPCNSSAFGGCGDEYYNSGLLNSSTLTDTASNIPTDGSTVYVRLWYDTGVGNWQSVLYTYTSFCANCQEVCDDGQDNDGDGLTDCADPDCEGQLCDDGQYCSVGETCQGGICTGGTARDCSDNVNCTDDSCNIATDSCDNVPNDAYCADDGLYCNGIEYCDLIDDCISTGNPCYPDNCIEATEICDAPGEPMIINPQPGTALPCGDITFTWDANGTAVSEWWLWIGTTQGGQEIVNSGSMGTRTSTDPVSGLPQDGSQIWVRLHYKVNGLWEYIDYQYTVAGPGTCTPEISTPVPDSTLSGSSVDFTWTANGTAVSAWYLWAGSCNSAAYGGCGDDYFNSGQMGGGTLNTTVSGLPTDGSTLYLRLWYNAGDWQSVLFQYTGGL